MTATTIDRQELEDKVKAMYKAVAENPGGRFHFEMGRALAERLGYQPSALDRIPSGAIESFAGVGHFFDLADLREGEHVLDLGSGSGMDAFVAALAVGERGRVAGIDMTPAQLDKAERLRDEGDFGAVEFTQGRIDELPYTDGTFDVVISNGVINLSPDKPRVFAEAARVLRPGGRLAVADIVTERPLTEKIVCNTDLWASCIGGAAQEEAYQGAITAAGFSVVEIRANDYHFISTRARNASHTYGVKSLSILARGPA
ncbi:methyltransferase domain-containing protein [Antribacter sp. KLBMP9083]|uniref:Arsenite methyltransferase n=1 Tax=Antribacter soli TaxID=2910976 RepID=A0AA41U5Z6_9MICO|nr:methyltransferase domain-containing protein [Antribacter soli]MCF4119896.1 methyltransferase domain-containing protein [Antribacter soli]